MASSENLILSVLTPERRLVESTSVTEVTLTGSEGRIQILPGHAPMIGTLETGYFSYRTADGALTEGAISTGFFEVSPRGEVVITGETLELKGEIDLNRAKKAQQIAETALQEAGLDEHRFKKYQLKLQRALIRQQIASHSL